MVLVTDFGNIIRKTAASIWASTVMPSVNLGDRWIVSAGRLLTHHQKRSHIEKSDTEKFRIGFLLSFVDLLRRFVIFTR